MTPCVNWLVHWAKWRPSAGWQMRPCWRVGLHQSPRYTSIAVVCAILYATHCHWKPVEWPEQWPASSSQMTLARLFWTRWSLLNVALGVPYKRGLQQSSVETIILQLSWRCFLLANLTRDKGHWRCGCMLEWHFLHFHTPISVALGKVQKWITVW